MRLIDADALLSSFDVRKVVEYDESGCGMDYKAVPVEAIVNAPTIDAELVRHGRWIGAIISGYQGIGKSSLAKNGEGYIDLESGNFFIDGARDGNWFKIYAQIAIHLAEQGYRVFVSSHQLLREYLAEINPGIPLYVCFPSYALEKAWIAKLRERYERSQLDKDFRAWKGAESYYQKNIKELHASKGYIPIIIHDMDYSLSRLMDRNIVRDAKMGVEVQHD